MIRRKSVPFVADDSSRARIVMAALAFAPFMTASVAHARSEFTVDTAATVSAASNPYLLRGSDLASASLSGSITPALTIIEAEGAIRASGTAQSTFYARRYPDSAAFSAAITADWRFNPRWSLALGGHFDDAITGEVDRFSTDLADPLRIIDPSLIGLRTRTRTYSVNGDISYTPSARETFGLGSFAQQTSVGGNRLGGDYAVYGARGSYNRTISASSSVGGTLRVSRYECRGVTRCNSRTFQPALTFATKLDRRWTLNASAGVSITRFRVPGFSDDTVSVSGSASLCRRDVKRDFCVTASRSVEPSALNGTRLETSIDSSFQYRLTPRDTLGFDASYARSSSAGGQVGAFLGQTGTYTYFTGRVTGSHQITQALRTGIEGSYRSIDSPVSGGRSSVAVALDIQYALGSRK